MKKTQAKIVARIQGLLAKKKKSPEKLAFEIGMSKSYVYAFLAGEKGISLDSLERIAKGLEITVKDLFMER